MRRMLRESFVPVVLVLMALFLGLAYARYTTERLATHTTVIVIEREFVADGLDDTDSDEAAAIAGVVIDPSDDPRFAKAVALVGEGRLQDAEMAYLAILADGEQSRARNDLGVIYARQGNLAKALRQYDRALAAIPVYLRAYYNRGVALSGQGKYDVAILAYEQMLQRNPAHYESYYNMGIAHFKRKRYDEAIAAFSAASERAGGNRKAKAKYNLGLALRAKGKALYPQATEAFEAAIRVRPDYIEPRLALTTLQPDTRAGRQRREELYATVFALKPNYPPVYFHQGLSRSAAGDRVGAIAAYRKAVQFNPEYKKARYNLGLLLLSERRYHEARSQFSWLLKRTPDHAGIHFNMGRVAAGQRDYAGALASYGRAMSLREGNYPAAQINMGRVYVAQKRYDQAIEAYQATLRNRPDYPEAWYNLGLAYKRAEQIDQAIEAFTQAVTQQPDYAKAWYNLGLIRSRKGHIAASIIAYRKALEARPDYARAQLNLAVRLSNQRGLDEGQQQAALAEAIELYQVVIASDPHHAKAWNNLGLAYQQTGQLEDSEAAFRQVLTIQPENVAAYRSMAQVLVRLKRSDEAIDVLNQAIDLDTANPRLRVRLARLYQKAGRAAEAKQELKKAAALRR